MYADEINKIEDFFNDELGVPLSGYTTDDGTVYVNLEHACIGLGFTTTQDKFSATSGRKSPYTNIRWNRVFKYLDELEYVYDPIVVKKKATYIPENIFYALALKAKNKAAKTFQMWLVNDVIPSIRRTGVFASKKYDPIRALSVFAARAIAPA